MSEPDLQRMFVKLFAMEGSLVTQQELIPIFHEIIQAKALDEIWIDVTNYEHVAHGPGVVLIAHHAHYAMDEGDGRLGLLYTQKRGATGTNVERYTRAVMKAQLFARHLAAHEKIEGRLAFRTDELLIGSQDQLRTPNTDDLFADQKPLVATAVRGILGDSALLERVGDKRGPFTVRASRA